jgi:hypothetical protein
MSALEAKPIRPQGDSRLSFCGLCRFFAMFAPGDRDPAQFRMARHILEVAYIGPDRHEEHAPPSVCFDGVIPNRLVIHQMDGVYNSPNAEV